MKALNPKQRRFIAEYLIDLNATQAAIRAGYSPRSADIQAFHLLRHPSISRAVTQGKADQLASADLTATRVLEELRRLALFDGRSFLKPDGSLKPVHDWTPEMGAALAGFEVLIKNTKAGDGVQDTIHKIRLWDKPRSLELLAKHFALLTDVVRVSGEGGVIERLAAARTRLATRKAG